MITELIQCQNFIIATRDSGYKSTASALAELIDNSVEARAKQICITIKSEGNTGYEIQVADDGIGMNNEELKQAIQFGGSSKYNSRSGLGRYGMGLPNSSLSQARRFEITTWKNKNNILWDYLDIDEVVTHRMNTVLEPQVLDYDKEMITSESGTIVKWLRCDRLSHKSLKPLLKNLHNELGRLFRYHIWNGIKITINEMVLQTVDPLYLRKGNNIVGAEQFGESLSYQIKLPGSNSLSTVKVQFVEMPLEEWSRFSNDVKRDNLITKRAGVSILRAKREIDYGWYFMGDKRKENYDDWWRCEILFEPDLDELFGVTHTKQGITPSEYLRQILTPDIQMIARELNNRVRLRFIEVKKKDLHFAAKHDLEKVDHFLAPPLSISSLRENPPLRHKKGLEYHLEYEHLSDEVFFIFRQTQANISLILNKNHPFYDKIYNPLVNQQNNESKMYKKQLEILIFAAIRATADLPSVEKIIVEKYLTGWSRMLSTFIE